MGENTILGSIELTNCHVTELSPLTEVLRTNTTLKYIRIQNNRISDIPHLVEALKINTTLMRLDLSKNPISDISTWRHWQRRMHWQTKGRRLFGSLENRLETALRYDQK